MVEVSSDIAISDCGEVYVLENHMSGGVMKGDCDDCMEGGFDPVVTIDTHEGVWNGLSMAVSPSTDPTFKAQVNEWITNGITEGKVKQCAQNGPTYQTANSHDFQCVDQHVSLVLMRMAFEVRHACRTNMSGLLPEMWETYERHAADPVH